VATRAWCARRPTTPQLENLGDEGYFLRARLNVTLAGVDREVAEALVEAADQTCPYSNATRGNIDVAINVV
jgi:osmotically inducible protein OsmC